jgi:hypothetical protein
MANSLYELNDQLKAIDDILDNSTDAETNEILESAREEILSAIDDKCENILEYQSDLKGKIEQLKQEELRIHTKKKVLENRVEYLRQMLIWYMKSHDKTKMSCGTYDLTLGESAGKVVLDVPEEQIPAYLKRVTYTVDKTALKNTMINDCLYVADGDDLVLLAHLEPTPILRIK